jgi:hypothetical protein
MVAKENQTRYQPINVHATSFVLSVLYSDFTVLVRVFVGVSLRDSKSARYKPAVVSNKTDGSFVVRPNSFVACIYSPSYDSNSVRRPNMMFRVVIASSLCLALCRAKLADRSRVMQSQNSKNTFNDPMLPIEGPAYRATAGQQHHNQLRSRELSTSFKEEESRADFLQQMDPELHDNQHRSLSNQLSGCCYTYQNYGASSLCSLYGNDCQSGETPSHDSSDQSCSQDGLSFIGISFSVNTPSGNPYSYQLCDQFPMENIIDRDYTYVMSMDEDGWLVGGGYKTFDYSGKMPYV